MLLELKPDSWKNLFEVIRKSEIKSEGNFWTAVQRLEEQYDRVFEVLGDKNDNTRRQN